MISLAHDFGKLWDLCWCPSGAWDDPCLELQDPMLMNRLGLLALACGDGSVRIISLPHPIEFNRSDLYSAVPVVVLTPPDEGCHNSPWNTACTTISWDRTGGHSTILSGYANGCICQFDLLSRSLLLVTNLEPIIIRPYMMFMAHNSAVTSVTYAPFENSRYFASSGLDKKCFIWDREDTTSPQHKMEDGMTQALAWTCHWCGYFGAQSATEPEVSHTFFKECGYFNHPLFQLSSHGACTLSLSVSEWLNLEASCDAAGEVVMMGLPELQDTLHSNLDLSNIRMPIYRIELEPIPTSDSEFDRLRLAPGTSESAELPPWLDPNKATEPDQQDASHPETSDQANLAYCNTYEEITNQYQLVIKETPVRNLFKVKANDLERLAQPQTMKHLIPGQYTLASVNTVCWNPNPGSHWWLFSAGQAGLGRLSCVGSIGQPVFEKDLHDLQFGKIRT